MKLYKLTLVNPNLKEFEVFVLANNPKTAEGNALKAMIEWDYSYDQCIKFEVIASTEERGRSLIT